MTSYKFKTSEDNLTVWGPVNGSGKVYSYVRLGSNETADISPNSVFKLKQGDTVHIYMSGTFYYANSSCTRTYFQGHLIDLL